MIQRVQTKQKQSPAGGLLSDTGRRRGGGQIALREGRREGGSAKLPGGGGGRTQVTKCSTHTRPGLHMQQCGGSSFSIIRYTLEYTWGEA